MFGSFGRAMAGLFNYETPILKPAGAGVPHNSPPSPDQQKAVGELFGEDGLLIPTARSFSGMYNTFARVYSYRYDEAMRHFPENARAMRRDTFFSALMQERTRPLVNHAWEVVLDEDNPAGAKDDPDAEKVRRGLEGIVRRTKDFYFMREALTEDIWYGKYGYQVAWGEDDVAGERRKVITRAKPVDGDNIFETFEGDPAVAISSQDIAKYRRAYGDDAVATTDRMPVLKLQTPDLRDRFIIQRHMVRAGDYYWPETAGRVSGVGLRDLAYWSWWMRQEMLASAVSFLDKIGTMGLLLFYYTQGDESGRAAAENSAKEANRRNALAVPLPAGKDAKTAGVDLIPANMSGVQFLVQFIGEYFEGHIERLFVGQRSSSSNEGGGLGGTSMADFQKDTKYQLIQSDATRHSEGYTQDLLRVAKALNYPDAPWRYRFNLIVDDPRAASQLEMIERAWSMGVDYDADRIRAKTGEPKPEEGAVLLSKRADEQRQAETETANAKALLGAKGAGEPHKSDAGEKYEAGTGVEKYELSLPKKFSFVGVDLPESVGVRVRQMQTMIDPDDLAADGFELHPHITARFGLHTNDATVVAENVKGFGPVAIRTGDVSAFYGKDNGTPHDVLLLQIDSPDLERLNAKLGELPNTATYSEYRPHATIAYVKAGLADKYLERLRANNLPQSVRTHQVTFSDKYRASHCLPLV